MRSARDSSSAHNPARARPCAAPSAGGCRDRPKAGRDRPQFRGARLVDRYSRRAMTVRLVLADDHTMLRESLRRSLEAHSLDVVGEASDGEEAARLATELRPDVVLMDVSMPVLDGVEATRKIR